MEPLVLAVKIVRTGADIISGETIAISACVVDHKFQKPDGGDFFMAGYMPCVGVDEVYWNTYWGCRYKTFEPFTYNGPLSFHQRQKEMITEFFAFYQKWKAQSSEIILCTDDIMVDAYHIKQMVDAYMPEEEPFPFERNDKYVYDTQFIDVNSMIMGIPLWSDDISTGRWWDVVSSYSLPDFDRELYYKVPFGDAYMIAHKTQLIIAIGKSKFSIPRFDLG